MGGRDMLESRVFAWLICKNEGAIEQERYEEKT